MDKNDKGLDIKVGMKLGCVSSMYMRKCSLSTEGDCTLKNHKFSRGPM